MFYKTSVLKHFPKFIGKHLYQSLLFNKLPAEGLHIIKKETLTQVFSCEFCEIFKNINYRIPPGNCFWKLYVNSCASCTVKLIYYFCKYQKFGDVRTIFALQSFFLMKRINKLHQSTTTYFYIDFNYVQTTLVRKSLGRILLLFMTTLIFTRNQWHKFLRNLTCKVPALQN